MSASVKKVHVSLRCGRPDTAAEIRTNCKGCVVRLIHPLRIVRVSALVKWRDRNIANHRKSLLPFDWTHPICVPTPNSECETCRSRRGKRVVCSHVLAIEEEIRAARASVITRVPLDRVLVVLIINERAWRLDAQICKCRTSAICVCKHVVVEIRLRRSSKCQHHAANGAVHIAHWP